jgi:choloylglycine hydrolase
MQRQGIAGMQVSFMQSKRVQLIAIILIGLMSVGSLVHACSTFCLREGGRIVFGKNYDWKAGDGLLLVNKRGVRRYSDSKGAPAKWRSRYGSVTFNQFGRNFPSGGMNEAGLVIELMWVDGARYPQPDSRASVNCLEWIQYQLDTAATVNEVIASDAAIRIQSTIPLHYLIADRQGNVSTIEFINGKLVAHRGSELPVAALTNDPYAESLEFLNKTRQIPTDGGSPARFVRAASHVRKYKSGDPVSYAFDSLTDVAGGITQWSIVYEIDRGIIHFRTLHNSQIRTLDMSVLDFSCSSPVMMLDLQSKIQGNLAPYLKPYSKEANLKLITSSFAQTDFLAKTSQPELQRIAAIPEGSVCDSH